MLILILTLIISTISQVLTLIIEPVNLPINDNTILVGSTGSMVHKLQTHSSTSAEAPVMYMRTVDYPELCIRDAKWLVLFPGAAQASITTEPGGGANSLAGKQLALNTKDE